MHEVCAVPDERDDGAVRHFAQPHTSARDEPARAHGRAELIPERCRDRLAPLHERRLDHSPPPSSCSCPSTSRIQPFGPESMYSSVISTALPLRLIFGASLSQFRFFAAPGILNCSMPGGLSTIVPMPRRM